MSLMPRLGSVAVAHVTYLTRSKAGDVLAANLKCPRYLKHASVPVPFRA